MKRKVVSLIAGCAFLTLICLAIHSALTSRYFAEGRIILDLTFVEPTNEPAISELNDKVVQWWNSQPAAISNRLNDSERMSILVRNSAALDDSI